jgi:hypothetical protein
MLPLVVLHPPPPVVVMTRHLILLSSCRATSTSHCFELPPAFKTPPPLVRWCLWLIVTMPLIMPLLLLILSTIHHLLSANASPPVASCSPAGCHVTPVVAPPLPLVLLTCRLCLSSSPHTAFASRRAASALRHAAASCLLAPLLLFASLLPAGSHISSRCAIASSVHP